MTPLTPEDGNPKEPVALSRDDFHLLVGGGFGILLLLFVGAAALDVLHDGDASSVIIAIVGVGGVFMGALVPIFNRLTAIRGQLNGTLDDRIRSAVKEAVAEEVAALRDELMDAINDFTAPPKRK